ncbi:FAD-dependent oxidoreductase [Kiritimatiellota bacterium B12222]|nr:FAD-dependent oxidoreductase [Kiritimatiellota bacterium B12222]
MMKSIHEPAREIPVAYDCDLCVIGGSCTGVFAAVRAARLGMSVALVESNILLGGMATAAQVNEWHSLYDATHQQQIIGGLTAEVLDRLRRKHALVDLMREERGPYALFNSAALALELDALVQEHESIRVFLKAACVGGIREGNALTAAILEDKSGRRAIRARMFVDASGDGDLLRRTGFAAWRNETLQPVSYQLLIAGLEQIEERTGKGIWSQIRHLSKDFDYPLENATPWINPSHVPADIRNVYGPRLNGVDASNADEVTAAILESRRCHRALLEMIKSRLGQEVAAVSLAHSLGVRETWHARCMHRLTASDLLDGISFSDRIGRGTYPVDIHSSQGTLLRYLNGKEKVLDRDGKVTWRRWREDMGSSPTSYEIPYRCLVPESAENLLVAGRLLDADREAYGGVRVMVNMNQTGEAAGVAAWWALKQGVTVTQVNPRELRRALADGGSLVP